MLLLLKDKTYETKYEVIYIYIYINKMLVEVVGFCIHSSSLMVVNTPNPDIYMLLLILLIGRDFIF
jgi:hypothetical protein